MKTLILVTIYTFEFTFICMIAASFYFLLERYKLSDKYKVFSSLAFLTTILAVIEYYKMHPFFTFDALLLKNYRFPTEFRYITWLVATPIMLSIFFVLSGMNKTHKKTMLTVLSLNFMMIIFGYFSESSYSKKTFDFNFTLLTFACGFSCWLLIVWIYNSYLPKEVKKIKTPNKNDLLKCINILNKFVTYGWAIYPLGLLISLYDYTPETMLMRELVYNFGDLFNKIGFSMVCFFCAVKLSKIKSY